MAGQSKEPLCMVRDIYRLINDFESGMQADCGVGLNEGMLLCSLSKLGQSTSGQIAGLLGLTCSNASKVILSAEKKGLVERRVGERDKRQMLFQLTPQGRSCIEKLHCDPQPVMQLIEKIKAI